MADQPSDGAQQTKTAPVSAPVYVDQQPEEPRSSTSVIILVVNIVLLALAVFWVVWKSRGDSTGPGKAGVVPTAGTDTASGGKKGGSGGAQPGDFTTDPLNSAGGRGGRGGAGGADRGSDGPTDVLDRPASPSMKPSRRPPALGGEDLARTNAVVGAIEAMGPGLDVFRALTKKYPSSAGAANDANRGNEALTAWLSQKGRLDATGLKTGDTDGDGKAELLDPWGNPFIYFSLDDYANPQQVSKVAGSGGAAYAQQRPGTQDGGAQAPQGGPTQKFDDGAWQAADRYQLWSAGPNGVDDGGSFDDVASWTLN